MPSLMICVSRAELSPTRSLGAHMAGTSWVNGKFEIDKLAAEDAAQRTARKEEEQMASEQHLSVAWRNLIAAVTADIAEWNLLKSKKHLRLRTTPGRSGI